eukprot:scaffold159980_cov43-Prasinocladus_malaysianus.AAC.1
MALAILLQLPTMLSMLAWLGWGIRFTVMASRQSGLDGAPDIMHEFVAIPKLCQGGLSTLVCQAHIWRRMVIYLTTSLGWIPVLVIWVLPSNIWSHITEDSAIRLNDVSMMRLMRVPWLMMPVMMTFYPSIIALFTFMWDDNQDHLPYLRTGIVLVDIASIIYGIWLVVWSRMLHD